MSEAENPFRAPTAAEPASTPAWKWAIALLLYLVSILLGLICAVFLLGAVRWTMVSGIRHLLLSLLVAVLFGAAAWSLIRLARRLLR
jgi:hypothetical protein